MFGGATGPLRLLNSALGGQAGWLLGFAAVSALALLVATRLRRADARTGWLIAVGGAFLTTAVLFSFASGIFHPYYVSLLAPFTAALVGAGAAHFIRGGEGARVLGPLAIAAGVATELVVLGDYTGQLSWLVPVLIVVGALAAVALAAGPGRRTRLIALAAALGVLLIAPAVWAVDTLGHAVSGTFPEGGPGASASLSRSGPRGFGGLGRVPARRCRRLREGRGAAGRRRVRRPGRRRLRSPGCGSGHGLRRAPGGPGSRDERLRRRRTRRLRSLGQRRGPRLREGPRRRHDRRLEPVERRQRDHRERRRGGRHRRLLRPRERRAGAAGWRRRSATARSAGCSAKKAPAAARQACSAPRVSRASSGSGSGRAFGGRPGDSRAGSRQAIAAAAKACVAVKLGESSSQAGSGSSKATLYDCQGRASQLESTSA